MLLKFFLLLLSLQDVVFAQTFSPQSTGLDFPKNTCSEKQKAAIINAWDSAVSIAQSVEKYGGILWDRPAEVDFLGQPAFNQKWQQSIKNVIYKAATFGRGYWFQPKLHIPFSCDDLARRCKGGVAAYVLPKGQLVEKDTIIPCKSFFELPTCSSALRETSNKKGLDRRLDIRNYRCQGSVMLHEMFHLEALYNAGKQGPIVDISIWVDLDGQRKRVSAYGAIFAKALARYVNENMGKWVNRNAENLAYYALSKWVQGNIKAYPSLPHSIAEGSEPKAQTALSFNNGSLIITNVTEILLDTGFSSFEELIGNCQPAVCEASYETVAIDHITFPLAFQSTSDSATPPASKERWVPECRGASSDFSSVTEAEAIGAINQFCSNHSVTHTPISSAVQGYRHDGFPIGEPVTAWLWTGVGYSKDLCPEPIMISEDQCKTALLRILNGCNTDTTTKKTGGYLEVPLSCTRYWLYPVEASEDEPPESDPAIIT